MLSQTSLDANKTYEGTMVFLYATSSLLTLFLYFLFPIQERRRETIRYASCSSALFCQSVMYALSWTDQNGYEIMDYLSCFAKFIALAHFTYQALKLGPSLSTEQYASIQKLLQLLTLILIFSSVGLFYQPASVASIVLLYGCFVSCCGMLVWALSGKYDTKGWETHSSAAQLILVAVGSSIVVHFISILKTDLGTEYEMAAELVFRLGDVTFYYALLILLRPTPLKVCRHTRVAVINDTTDEEKTIQA